jgi:hypothetical protein
MAEPWFWSAEGVDRDGTNLDDGGGSSGPTPDGAATAVTLRVTLPPKFVVTEMRVRVRAFKADRIFEELEFYDLVIRRSKDATTNERIG